MSNTAESPPQSKRDLDVEYSFAVYGTQGGGLARFAGDKLIWVEPPKEFPEFNVTDEVPIEWDFQPANKIALETCWN